MSMNNKYPIHSIGRLRMGTDGEGIRTLVFLSGCPLRCKYCFNPATWDGSKEPKMMTAEEVYSKIRIDRPYILATNGGITFGGGEPLSYPDLINEMRSICEPEMTIYAETSLNVPWENIEKTAEAINKYYVDIKATDPEIYKAYTGGTLDIVVDNLVKLIQRKDADSVVVRIPEIEGFVDAEKQEESREMLYEMGVRRFNLFKYKV